MDYMKFVNYHREKNADISIGCIAYDDSRAKEFGLMKIDDERRVLVSKTISRARAHTHASMHEGAHMDVSM